MSAFYTKNNTNNYQNIIFTVKLRLELPWPNFRHSTQSDFTKRSNAPIPPIITIQTVQVELHFQGDLPNVLIRPIHQIEGGHHKAHATWLWFAGECCNLENMEKKHGHLLSSDDPKRWGNQINWRQISRHIQHILRSGLTFLGHMEEEIQPCSLDMAQYFYVI